MAVLFPRTYIRWREQLCMLSHISHKAAHAAVTLVPPVGTIFSASYNPSVALLESSSLAQIYMLSFGLKLRFGTHLIAGCFHFLASLAANEAVCAAGFPFLPGGCACVARGCWLLVVLAPLPTLPAAAAAALIHCFGVVGSLLGAVRLCCRPSSIEVSRYAGCEHIQY